MRRSTPYALAGLGLVVGLIVLLFRPLGPPTLNHVVGGIFLVGAVASVLYLIIEFSGPGERGPDF